MSDWLVGQVARIDISATAKGVDVVTGALTVTARQPDGTITDLSAALAEDADGLYIEIPLDAAGPWLIRVAAIAPNAGAAQIRLDVDPDLVNR